MNIPRQFILFASVGAVGTMMHFLVLYVLVDFGYLSVLLATFCGFLVGALTNYILNYQFTFKSTKSHKSTLVPFMLIAIFAGILNQISMALLTLNVNMHYMFAQCLVTGCLLIFTYSFNRLWTFRSQPGI